MRADRRANRRPCPALPAIDSVPFLLHCTAGHQCQTELELFDYLSLARFAVKKQRQKQEQCFNAGECAENTPYDAACLQRKRRLSSHEINNFVIDLASSTILLLAASGSIAVRIAAGLDAPKISR